MDRLERESLIEQYAAGYDEVIAALAGMTSEQLTSHPLAGKWSAAEIVHHLADSEMNSAIRLRRLLCETDPLIEAYDEAFYARHLGYNRREIEPALDALRGARATTLQIIRQMTEQDWQRVGRHTTHGRYGAEDWLRIYAVHAHNHAQQIRRLRESMA